MVQSNDHIQPKQFDKPAEIADVIWDDRINKFRKTKKSTKINRPKRISKMQKKLLRNSF